MSKEVGTGSMCALSSPLPAPASPSHRLGVLPCECFLPHLKLQTKPVPGPCPVENAELTGAGLGPGWAALAAGFLPRVSATSFFQPSVGIAKGKGRFCSFEGLLCLGLGWGECCRQQPGRGLSLPLQPRSLQPPLFTPPASLLESFL